MNSKLNFHAGDYEDDNQVITRSTGKTDKGVPYIELKVDYFYGFPITVTFRAYTKNVWITYNDDRCNPSSGADLSDCWLAPTVLFKKVPIKLFDLRKKISELEKHFDIYDKVYKQKILEESRRLKNE
jgi:hypothetical protein